MSRFVIALALIGIAGAFVSAEIILRPELFDKVKMGTDIAKVVPEIVTSSKNSPSPLPTKKEEEKPIPNEYFAISLLKKEGITFSQPRYSLALFQHVPIVAKRDSFYLPTFSFQINEKPIGTVSRIMPVHTISAGRLMSLVQEKLRLILPTEKNDKLSLSDSLKTIGKANFYLNDRESFPNTIFLVTRSDTKVLAFQYPSEYHETVIKKLIPLFFQ